jgi:holo-[acyl-carrier protein] synthase
VQPKEPAGGPALEQHLYHGIDIVEVDRIMQAVTRWGDRFLQRVFTAGELADAAGRMASLAARFAAKEATAKAMGVGMRGLGLRQSPGIGAIGWAEIEVIRLPGGRPALRLHGRAAAHAAALGWTTTALSLSHTGQSALASVIAFGTATPPDVPV